MTHRRSLETRIARWFAFSLLALYGVLALGVWGSARQRGRQIAVLTLENEVEAIAGYVATTGRMDAAELLAPEEEPFPIWVRLIDGSTVLAATPGAPDLPPGEPRSTEEVLYLRTPGAVVPHLVVRHAVGGEILGKHGTLSVEAIGDISPVRALEQRLAVGLVAFGLLIIPVAARGGRLLARRALAPIANLVDEIRSLSPGLPDGRLHSPPKSVEEVDTLTASFNEVLDRLQQSVATIRRFTADASHEIRNPLAVMRTGLEVALRHQRSTGEYETLLRENLDEVQRLQSILEGLLTLARAEPGTAAEIQCQTVDLAAMARETVARFGSVIAESGSRIVSELPPALEIEGDAQLLRLVVFNLLDNALKHGPAGQTVTLSLARAGEQALLRVVDEGPGIAAEHRPHIFERYYRSTKSSPPPNVGGLGLSVVHWVAEAHHGSVALLDSARGAAFEVRLPVARPA